MRRPAFRRRMSLLALAAALLLLLVPTVGRLLAASEAQRDGLWAQMCTAAGLSWVELGPAPALQPEPHASHHEGGMSAGEDCAYCPLLATMLVFAVALWPALLHTPAPRRRPRRTRLPRLWHPCGLGSRGPPAIA